MEMIIQFLTPILVPVWKDSPMPIDQGAGWAPELAGQTGEEKDLVDLSEIEQEFVGCPTRSVASYQVL